MMEKYYNECVTYALGHKGINADSLEDAGMRVFYRDSFLASAIFSAIGKGGIVMPMRVSCTEKP